MASLVSSCSRADEMSKSESSVGSAVLLVRVNFLYRTGRSSPPVRATSAKGLDHQRLRLGQLALGLQQTDTVSDFSHHVILLVPLNKLLESPARSCGVPCLVKPYAALHQGRTLCALDGGGTSVAAWQEDVAVLDPLNLLNL